MEIKKYAFITALMLGIASGAWAQLGGVHNYMDSSYIPASRMAQQNEWRNNSPSQNFPARPRDQWQLGIYGGYFAIAGDVASLPGWDVGVSIRKALGYTVSLRASIAYGQAYGLGYAPDFTLANIPNQTVQNSIKANGGYYVDNYQTQTIAPALDALFSLNNIMFHKNKSKLNVYLLAGYSPMAYMTNLNLLNSSGVAYNWSALGVNFNQKRSDIRKQIKAQLDGSYETGGIVKNRDNNFGENKRDVYHFRHSFDFGAGLEYRVGKSFSIGLETKLVYTASDYLDGKVYALLGNPANGTLATSYTPNSDIPIYTNLSFNFNLGNPKKRVAPLWWLNPLDYLYSETNNPKHTKFPPVVLPDADGDGVTDQFDVEPNTPAGCPVDSHGKSRDTDGDGVPDCRDKELITPTACQPVNADGVGKCPCPDASCFPTPQPPSPKCQIGDLPSVSFKTGSAKLSKDAEAILMAAAAKIKANPDCKIAVIGHGVANKRAQQLSWDHVNAVINYLTEKEGISGDRFVFKYGEEGDPNTVDLRDGTGEEGPSTVPAPHPQYQKK
jgi:outer membrane protein OmpA-like peptidoglycan-associated protein